MGLTFELEESDAGGGELIDDGTVVPARVLGHNLRERNYKDGPIKKVGWKFQIEDGEYAGRIIWGETSTKFVKHPNCKLYTWCEAVLGMPLPGGYRIDLDTVVDRDCRIVITKDEWISADGEQKARNYVSEVHPNRENAAALAADVEDF